MMRVHLFGGLALFLDETPLPAIPSLTARSLLAFLLTHRDRPHMRDLLAGAFWPDLPDALARRRLSQALWQIRKHESLHAVLVAAGETVQVHPDLSLWLDVDEFTRHAGRRKRGDVETLARGEACIALYRGEFMAGYYDDWIVPERERLREVLLETLGRLVDLAPVAGVVPDALTVSWAGGDADGDPLSYTIYASGDGGASWRMVACGLSAETAELDTTFWPATGQGMLRVVASDGVNVGSAEAGPFTVPAHPPAVAITAPADREALTPGYPAILAAAGYDAEDGQLPDDAFVWSSDRDGPLGAGETLVVDLLSAGWHQIRVDVTDSDANASSDTIAVYVGHRSRLPLVVKG